MISVVRADGSESGLARDLEAAVLAVAVLTLAAEVALLPPTNEPSLACDASLRALGLSRERPLLLALVLVVPVPQTLWDLVRVLVRGLARAPVDVVPLTALPALLVEELGLRWPPSFCESSEPLGNRREGLA